MKSDDHLDNVEHNEQQIGDEHADRLVETFSPEGLVDVNVSSEFDKVIEQAHLSPRDRGRGKNNTRGGRRTSRGRGGRSANQQPVFISQEHNLSN